MTEVEYSKSDSSKDFIPNPHIKDFIGDVREKGDQKNPYLLQQEQISERIMSAVNDLTEERKELIEKYPELMIRPEDQFALTPYDDLEGLRLNIPDEILIRAWEIERDENLFISNHPARIFTIRQLESRGFIPPPRLQPGVLDDQIRKREVVQLSDLGQARQLFLTEKEAEHPQVHRIPFLAVGPLSYIGRRVRSYIGVGAMSDITGSVLAGVTLSKMHVPWCVSKDGKFRDIESQVNFIKAVVHELNNLDDPLLEGRSDEEKKEIIERWISCMIVSLEADPDKALTRFEAAHSAGAQSARPYQHTAGVELVHTTKTLRDRFENIEIISSQLSSTYIALKCEEAGADAEILGVGSGGLCITADMGALTPTNAHLPWILRGSLGIPLLGEGGAVNNPVVSALVGMSGVLGSGSLGGGTFEAPGGMFFFTRDEGKTHIKPYRGEASPHFKFLGSRTYPSGAAFFSEGDGTFRQLDSFKTSITSRIRDAWEAVIVGASDIGLDGNDPDIIGQIQRLDPSPLVIKTAEGDRMQKTHSK